MKIVIRADASIHIGSGHIMRCLVLANALKEQGHTVSFASRPQQGDLVDFVRNKGFEVIELITPIHWLTPQNSADYSFWLQVPWQEDAKEFIKKAVSADLVITDHYAIDAMWEQMVKSSFGCAILAIDDLNRKHESELIVDQNLWPDIETRYQESPGVKLLGPEYALLRRSFSSLRAQDIPCKNQVLAFFGGSDLTLECLKLAKAACNIPSLPFTLKIVSGRANSAFHELLEITEGTKIIVEQFIDDFDMEIKQSNYIIGASGVSNWERFCLQVPASIVSVAENQKILSKYLADLGTVRLLGYSDDTSMVTYYHELLHLSSCWPNIQPLKSVFVDGGGVSRIVTKIEEVLDI